MSNYKDPDKVINVLVEGYDPFDARELERENISIVEADSDGNMIIRVHGLNVKVKVLNENFQKGSYTIRLNGKTFICKTETNLDLLIKELGFNQVKKSKEKEIYAPMPGMVLDVQVENGETVDKDQILLTLEAMKMENIIKAPHNGHIEQVHIKRGDKVEKNQLLITME